MAPHGDLLNPRRRNPLLLPLVVVALFAVAGGAFLLGRMSARQEVARAPETEAPPPAEPVAAVEEPPPAPAEVAMGEPIPGTEGLRRLAVEIRGSLTASITEAIGSEVGEPLSLVASRLLVWWLNPSRDLRAGDRLEILYTLAPNEEPTVHALRFRAQKLGNAIRQAYRFHASEEPFPRYYDEEGNEVELRLREGPIRTYEQITSLLRDGRRHQGVDFKAPVGTEVRAPWAATVVRKNWNYRFNGGSLELQDDRGRRIIFLHLDSVERSLKPGTRVSKGQVIARSGNTGRSTAPHLHYQVMSPSGKVLDPFDLHETWRASLPAADAAAFRERVAALDALLRGELPASEPGGTAAAAAAEPKQAVGSRD